MLVSTERLDLRPCAAEDVDALLALWHEPAMRRYLLDDRIVTREEVAEYVESFLSPSAERGHGLWLVETPSNGAVVGFAALKEIPGSLEVEVAYGLAPEFWGQGLATEAARAVLAYGFEVLDLARIWARTDPPNEASKRVAERLGMKPALDPGETSLVSFVIAREEWHG